jgi:hypothetical protein
MTDIFWPVCIDFFFWLSAYVARRASCVPIELMNNNLNPTIPRTHRPCSLGILGISDSNCPKVYPPSTASNQRWPFDDHLRRRTRRSQGFPTTGLSRTGLSGKRTSPRCLQWTRSESQISIGMSFRPFLLLTSQRVCRRIIATCASPLYLLISMSIRTPKLTLQRTREAYPTHKAAIPGVIHRCIR